jgi:hypothetical protein
MTSILRYRAFLASLTTTLAVVVFASSGTRAQQAPAQKAGDNRVTEAQWTCEVTD